MGATLSLFISVILITGLFVLKHAELKREVRFFEQFRSQMDDFVRKSIPYLTHTLPRQLMLVGSHALVYVAHQLSILLLSLVHALEQHLHRFTNVVKGKREVERRKASSSFFEDVSNHKQEARESHKIDKV